MYKQENLPDLLPTYYKRLFPFGPYYRWLSYGGVPKTIFTNREFSFTLKDDIYIRYQSFYNQQDLEREVVKACPHKIDIGAIFNHRPKERNTLKIGTFTAMEKELVFDIDMTDYDDVRTCCSNAEICSKCWPLMNIAMCVLDKALREDFGFHLLLWVYSGRRGIHCWVCDESARKLSQQGRSAVAEYLSLVKSGEHIKKKVKLQERLHTSIKRAVEIIRTEFSNYAIGNQDFLSSHDDVKKIASLAGDEKFAIKIESILMSQTTTRNRWNVLCEELSKQKMLTDFKGARRFHEEVMLQYCYPRLDINVSKGLNHLLKSPFCVHPKTGRICIPIDPHQLSNFEPFGVPTISELCNELDELPVDDGENKGKVYKKSLLSPYILVFEKFLKEMEKSRTGKAILLSDEKGDF